MSIKQDSNNNYFFDLDDFSKINRVFGSDTADDLMDIIMDLFDSAPYLKQHKVIRWNKDEFVLCLPNMTIDKAYIHAEKIRNLIQKYNWSSISPDLFVTGSFGVAQKKEEESTLDWILRAIQGSVKSKQNGGNLVTKGPLILPKNLSRRIQDYLS